MRTARAVRYLPLRRLAVLVTFALFAAALPATALAVWGGPYTGSTGETVRVTFSDAYPQDPALQARWGEYLVSLVHGPELATVGVFIGPLAEVQAACGGEDALACYSGRRSVITSPGEDVPERPTAEAILAHEYGHHIARSRLNTPWDAGDYGTKRWATAMNVCARAQAGDLAPGNEDARYALNPGEGIAEAYRLLNERRLGRPETPWSLVDATLAPSEAVLRLLEEDIRNPWTAPTAQTLRGSFATGTQTGATRNFPVATPLDGRITVTLRSPTASRFELTLLAGGKVVAQAPAGSRTIAATVCGQRSFTVRVQRARGSGAFSVAIAKP